MPRTSYPDIRLTVQTTEFGWTGRSKGDPIPSVRRPPVTSEAAQVAELPDYLAFATVLALAAEPETRWGKVPRELAIEAEIARSLAGRGFPYPSPYRRYSYDTFAEIRDALLSAGQALFEAVLGDPERIAELTPPEYEHIRRMWQHMRREYRRAYRDEWYRPWEHPFADDVRITRLSIASPAEIVFAVTGPLGVAFAIMIVTQWLATRAEHDQIHINNKKLAAEAARIVLDKLKSGEAPVSSDAVAAVIQNARIAPTPLPPIANVKIDVGAG